MRRKTITWMVKIAREMTWTWLRRGNLKRETVSLCRTTETMPLRLIISKLQPIGVMFANGPGDRDSISGQVIPRTQKVVLVSFLLNAQYYKVRIKGKCSNRREGITPSHHYIGVVAVEKGAHGSHSTTVGQITISKQKLIIRRTIASLVYTVMKQLIT